MRTATQEERGIDERHGIARLVLTIGDTSYAARPYTDPDGSRVVRLRKSDGTVYLVSQEAGGETARTNCSCPDFIHGVRSDRVCKHLGACRAIGLIGGDW